jgi:CheY-like chemotaxis protein
MPVMDGLEASRSIRLFEKESKKNRVPIVAITGAASESAHQEAYTAGIDRFLAKPVSLKVLKEIIEACIPHN